MISTFDYEQVKPLNSSGSVWLLKNKATGDLLVKKTLKVYDLSVYQFLYNYQPKGIPLIYQYTFSDESLVVYEEFVPGSSLAEKLNESGPFDYASGLSILIAICDILAPLHHATPAIVHRDIKPSNIMLADNGEVYLLDFNAATKFSNEKDLDTVLIGTTGYAAPEQYGFKASDPRADVYAIGRVAQDIFQGERVLPENYKGPCDQIIKHCLNLDPNDRYSDADALGKAFKGKSKLSSAMHKWYRLPGFRSGKPLHMILSAIGYFIFLLSVTPYSDGRKVISGAGDAFALIFAIAEFLFLTNYMNIQKKLPLSSSENTTRRILGILLYTFVIFLLFVVVAMALRR